MSRGELSLQVILAALAGWLGSVFAGRIARNEQSSLDERIRRLESALESAAHVSNAQYDREFQIYRDLWEKLCAAVGVAAGLPWIKHDEITDEEVKRKSQAFILMPLPTSAERCAIIVLFMTNGFTKRLSRFTSLS